MVTPTAARGGTISNVRSNIDGRVTQQVVSKSGNSTTFKEVDVKTGETLRQTTITNQGRGIKTLSSSSYGSSSSPSTPAILKPYSTEGISDKLGLRPSETKLGVPYKDTYDVNYRGETSRYVVSRPSANPIDNYSTKAISNRLGLTPKSPQSSEVKPNIVNRIQNTLANVDERVSQYLFEPSPYAMERDGTPVKTFNPKPFREGQRLYFKLPGEVSREDIVKSNVRVTYNNDFAGGIRKEITERPVSTALLFTTPAVAGTGYSYTKLGFVKLASKIPAFQKSYKFISTTEKIADVGLSGAYLGLSGLNVASSDNKASALGSEFVKFSAVAGGINTASRLSYKANYMTNFETNFQKVPQPKQDIYRSEFNLLKSQLPGISQGSVNPSRVPFNDVEALQKFPRSQNIVKSFLLENKGDLVIGGSLSSRTQIKPSMRSGLRAAGDIDVYTDKSGLAKDLSNRLSTANIPSYYRGNKVFIKGVGKAVEFQGLSENGRILIKSKQSLQGNFKTIANPLRSVYSAYTFTPEGFAVTKINVQAARKLYGGFEFSQDKLGRVYSYRYSKDIPDYNALVKATQNPNVSSNSFNKMFASSKGQLFLGSPAKVSSPKVSRVSNYYSNNDFYSYKSFYNYRSNVYASPLKPIYKSSLYNSFKPSSYSSSKPYENVKPSSPTGYSSRNYRFNFGYSSNNYSSSNVFKYSEPKYNYRSMNYLPSSLSFVKPYKRKGTKKEGKKLSGKIKNLSYYVPSIEANLFNIKSKKVNLGLAKTGLTLRPILK